MAEIDREKVINDLQDAVNDDWMWQHADYYAKAMENAIALLKEQEAIEPSFKQGKDGIFVWCCGSCGAYMYHIYDGIDKAKEYAKYCRQCGKKVNWE